MSNRPRSPDFTSPFYPIGVIAGSGPEAGVDLWAKILAAARAALGNAYRGDASAPFVRIISDPALGLASAHQSVIDQHLQDCVLEISEACRVFTIACNALQARAKALMTARAQEQFISFDIAVDNALSRLNASSFFLLGSSVVMSLSSDSVYAPLKYKYVIKTPKDWDRVDALIGDIKLTGGKDPELVQRLEALVAEAGACPVVLACTDFPLVPARFFPQTTIDATGALAVALIEIVVRSQGLV
jgi:aspartate racemase